MENLPNLKKIELFKQQYGYNTEILNNNDLIKVQRKCRNCGYGVSETADICENCGEWLLIGKCNFCYADIEEGQKFCSECGNPPFGIKCDKCGCLSHFDFCPQCNNVLTEQAQEYISIIENSIEFRELVKIDEKKELNTNERIDQSNIQLEKLSSYLSKFNEQKSKKKNLFSLKENPNNNIEENLKAVEQSKLNIKNEEQIINLKQQKEIQAIKLLEETRNKTFSSNQEARKFFGALKILLPKVIQKRIPLGWTCNAYSCTHSGGPQECADPSQGGTWSYDLQTEETFIETEI